MVLLPFILDVCVSLKTLRCSNSSSYTPYNLTLENSTVGVRHSPICSSKCTMLGTLVHKSCYQGPPKTYKKMKINNIWWFRYSAMSINWTSWTEPLTLLCLQTSHVLIIPLRTSTSWGAIKCLLLKATSHIPAVIILLKIDKGISSWTVIAKFPVQRHHPFASMHSSSSAKANCVSNKL